MAQKRRVRVDSRAPVAQPDFSVPVTRKRGAETPPSVDDSSAEIDVEENCVCPRLDRDDWHEVESDWTDAVFVRTELNAALGVPLGYNNVREKLVELAESAGATVPDDAMLLLGEGKFRRPMMLEVEGAPLDGKGFQRPGGVIYSRLLPAPMGQIKKVVGETVEIAKDRYGRKPDRIWLWYLTCRICSAARDFETLVIAHYRRVPA